MNSTHFYAYSVCDFLNNRFFLQHNCKYRMDIPPHVFFSCVSAGCFFQMLNIRIHHSKAVFQDVYFLCVCSNYSERVKHMYIDQMNKYSLMFALLMNLKVPHTCCFIFTLIALEAYTDMLAFYMRL